MTRAAPSHERKGPRHCQATRTASNRVSSAFCHTPEGSTRSYELRIRNRVFRGLLTPFRCSNCGELVFDPLGRNNKQEFLCGECAE